MRRIALCGLVVFVAACHHASDSPDDLGRSGDLAGTRPDSAGPSEPGDDLAEASPDFACTDTQNDPVHCGSCGNACTAPDHAIARCEDGTCGVACGRGYALSGGACVPCPAGTISALGANVCTACAAGSYASADASSCTACPAGSSAPTTGAGSCEACGAGTFASAPGSTSCTTCTMACEAALTACTTTTDTVCCPNGMAGLGSAASPCLVKTCTDLQGVAQGLTLHYRVANAIDCSATSTWNGGAGFLPIASFSGELDGSSLPIDGLFESTTGNAGVFGDASGTLHDIELTHVSLTGGKYTGGLVGKSTATITSCSVSGTVAAPTAYAVGGLVGYASGPISGCSTAGAVSGYDDVGGLVGDWEPTSGVELTGSTSSMQVAGGSYNAGGLVAHSNGPVSGCSATGNVTGDDESSNSIVGGLIGYHLAGAITSCSASGTVYRGRFVGGLVGAASDGPITLSFATGDVTATTSIDGYAGGLVGYQVTLAIDQCYATGNVTGAPTNGALTGGLVGCANGGSIGNSYARGNVMASAGEFAGGLVGEAYSSMGFSNNYATGAVSIASGSAGGIGGFMSVTFTGPCFATGALMGSANSGCGVACDGDSLDGSYWYEAPGTDATGCGGSNNTTCAAIPQSAGLAYFYTVANPPMSSWSFGASNPWSSICNGVSFPVLTFQGLTSTSQCH